MSWCSVEHVDLAIEASLLPFFCVSLHPVDHRASVTQEPLELVFGQLSVVVQSDHSYSRITAQGRAACN